MKKSYPTLLFSLLMLVATSLLAEPPGLMRMDKTPAGFSMGEKTGWQGGDQPPGWDKSGRGSSMDDDGRERYRSDYDSLDTDDDRGKGKSKSKSKSKGKGKSKGKRK